jgi:hypothetical protein
MRDLRDLTIKVRDEDMKTLESETEREWRDSTAKQASAMLEAALRAARIRANSLLRTSSRRGQRTNGTARVQAGVVDGD